MKTIFNILLFLLNNLESSSFFWVTFGGKPPIKRRCSSQAYFSMINFLWVVVFLSSIFISSYSLWSIVQLPYTLLLCHIQNITSVNVFDSYKVIEVGMGYTEKRETSIQMVYQRLLQKPKHMYFTSWRLSVLWLCKVVLRPKIWTFSNNAKHTDRNDFVT